MFSRLAMLSVLGTLLAVASVAQADLLLDDPNAMPGWSGQQEFFKTDGVFLINVKVGYAVYAPGKFDDTFSITDPSGGSDYVYAYQVLNLLNPGSEEISKLSVGLIPLNGAHNIGMVTSLPVPVGAIVPTGLHLSGSSARWNFDDPTILYGEQSVVLFFTSPNAPRWLSGSVQDGGPCGHESDSIAGAGADHVGVLPGWRRSRHRGLVSSPEGCSLTLSNQVTAITLQPRLSLRLKWGL